MSLRVEGLEASAGRFTLRAAFEVPLDGVTVLFGPSGAGKSILLKTLAGLHAAKAGRILLDDRALFDRGRGVDAPAHRRGVGLVFQEARLFPHLTVRGNLDYARKRAPAGAARPDMDRIAQILELDHLIDRPVSNLSGGEKSRVALARGILAAPRLLLLDEPFAALDGRRRRSFLRHLLELNREIRLAMVVVTHLIEDAAELADHVVAIRSGEVVVHGRAEAAMRSAEFQNLLDPRDAGCRLEASSIASGMLQPMRGVWVRADTVTLASENPRGLSARNVWEGVVTRVDREDQDSVLVQLDTGVGMVMSRVTVQAAAELGLETGRRIWSVVKTHAL